MTPFITKSKVQNCPLINLQYKPTSFQYSWLSVEQPIRIDWVLYKHCWEFPINKKTITMLKHALLSWVLSTPVREFTPCSNHITCPIVVCSYFPLLYPNNSYFDSGIKPNDAEWKPTISRLLFVLALTVIMISTSMSAVYMYIEGWSYLDSLYFCFVSFATIGK